MTRGVWFLKTLFFNDRLIILLAGWMMTSVLVPEVELQLVSIVQTTRHNFREHAKQQHGHEELPSILH